MTTSRAKRLFFLLLMAACALPAVNTVEALVAGILFSLLLDNPWPGYSAAWSKKLLQVSVVGLGFGLSAADVWQVSKGSVGYTVIGIALTLTVGVLLGRLFGAGRRTSTLIAFGTAICGGSAIAAMSPVLGAEDEETAVALATVFTLNAGALLLFPALGHLLQLGQHQFGVWAGLAIHDTSSVVGAAAAYGNEALEVGTVVKLARAVWIAPVVLACSLLFKSEQKAKIPLFIIGFIAAAVLRSLLPQLAAAWGLLARIARQSLVVTLFLIGAGLSRQVFREIGLRPLLQGVTLWVLVSGATLGALLEGWIR